MEWYVFAIAKEAAGDRNWHRALNSAKDMLAFEEQLEKEKHESNGNG
jgi:hypothetical protein